MSLEEKLSEWAEDAENSYNQYRDSIRVKKLISIVRLQNETIKDGCYCDILRMDLPGAMCPWCECLEKVEGILK